MDDLQIKWANGHAMKFRAAGCFEKANEWAENAHQLQESGRYLDWSGMELSDGERIQMSRDDSTVWDELTDAGVELEWPRPFGPRREGSSSCKDGSIASGGNKTYCTCSICF